MFRLMIILATLVLTSCTTFPLDSSSSTVSWQTRKIVLNHLNSWQIHGKIAVQTPQNAGSATIDWLQRKHHYYTITLFNPLGSPEWVLTGEPGNVSLKTANGAVIRANNPDQLLLAQWGYQVPVSYLYYWIRGMPAPNVPSYTHYDSASRLSKLTQLGFQIQYLNYTAVQGIDMPTNIIIRGNNLVIKMMIYQWQIN